MRAHVTVTLLVLRAWLSFPLREQVYVANETRLQRLGGELRTFEALDAPGYDISNHLIGMDKAKQLLNRLIAPEVVKLKVPILFLNFVMF